MNTDWLDSLPIEFRIGKDVWRIKYVRKSTIKVNGEKCWGGCWLKEQRIKVCIGPKSKPLPRKKVAETLWHEFGHAASKSLGFKKKWKEAREKAEEQVCCWLGEKIAKELADNNLL